MNEKYMHRAIELAKKGMGHTSPNPMVGCVVVKNGNIISEGFHEKIGGFHAERNALLNCKEDLRGADLYVTLEPCCHFGKTPPCTDIIIEKGISRVFVGAMDSNPLVAGKGVSILREHGIEVETNILEKECKDLNEVFFYYIRDKIPFVAMKYAMTLDGKIACESGDSKWVTSAEARNHVQYLRKKYSGIMVGIGTVLLDDPMLDCRIEEGVNPVRIICDTHLRLPLKSQIALTAHSIPTYLVYGEETGGNKDKFKENEEKIRQYEKLGIKLLPIPLKGSYPDLDIMLVKLGEAGIDGILVEGGGTLNASFLKQGMVNRIYAYIAPKIVGGKEAKSPVEGSGILKMSDALRLSETKIKYLGEDILITGKLMKGGGDICLPE